MTDTIESALRRLGEQLPGRVSRPGDDRYTAATTIWTKPLSPLPRVVVHCRTPTDVRAAIRAAQAADLRLSVRGGGHDWACRALCDGIVVDLSEMNGVVADAENRTARISGGARAADVVAVTDRLGLAAVTGSTGAVGMTGLTLGGGYGPLIGRYGLALDNLLSAEVVLADGRIVHAHPEGESELFWALRGGGGNFGVVTAMQHRLHDLPSVRSGMLVYPFAEAKAVLEHCVDIMATAPEALTVQLGLVLAHDGVPIVMVVPTWSGPGQQGEACLAPFFRLGTLLAGTVDAMPYGVSLTAFDPLIVNGYRNYMETCWLPELDGCAIDIFVEAIANAVAPGCAIITHEFKGAASRVPPEATAFGLRRDHVLVEILTWFVDRSDPYCEHRHRRWAQSTRWTLEPMALPGGYPAVLANADTARAARSYGHNAARLMEAKRRYDPDNLFRSAVPLPFEFADGRSVRLAGS